MNLDEASVRERCTDPVFERGQSYYDDGRLRRLDRFDDLVTAVVRGSDVYDVVVEFDGDDIDARCSCPYTGPGECKHIVAVLLDVVCDPPEVESERVDAVLGAVPPDDLRAFVRDALAENPTLREQFLARFGEEHRSIDEYRTAVETLFDRHARDDSLVTSAIDFSHFFDLAQRYRTRERYLAAATVYRALFEAVDDNAERIDAAYDHYATTLRTALDGYVECVLAADLPDEDVERYATVLEDRRSEYGVHTEAFRRGLEAFEAQR
ncbi:SWIM zinc finger family protein [Natrinema amylolyticum]|uniref:SWIM zinc finger family protein n=1 Tax=Natrinema amylolyticum TaxID=2878679 RepID=UPI001CFA225C|nr:SWIM zinc finger family protein [Natrinema amylolyticum]